jgi:phosphoglycolate phosphatase-like HAD superfamily hydrolase
MIKKLAIYDMDGTIIDSSHRYKTLTKNGVEVIDLDYWRKNCTPEKIAKDSLLPLASQYQADLKDSECYVIIATARVMSQADFTFINNVLGTPNHIIYRKEGDNQSGGSLKIKGLQKFFNLKNFKVAFANACFYEDNTTYLKAVCDYFKIKGLYVPSTQGH